MSDDDPAELRRQQEHREAAEAERAEDAVSAEEEKLHEARADRAAYLKEKLAEQEAADEEREQ